MPSIKDFENKNKKSNETSDGDLDLNAKKKKSSAPRRRPGRDEASHEASIEENLAESNSEDTTSGDAAQILADDIEVEVMDAEEILAKIDEEEKASADAHQEHAQAKEEARKDSPFKKINVHVPGTDVTLTFATPEKVVEIADSVVEDWKNDGAFDALPLGSPIAQLIASKGLRKAKDIEKKLEEKGVFVMAQMGVDYLKSKLKK